MHRFFDHPHLPPKPQLKTVAYAWLGAVLAIMVLAAIAQSTHVIWILGSFGASAVLVFGVPHATFSQPRNIMGGYLISAICSVAGFYVAGYYLPVLALITGTAIALMMISRTLRPPAGSAPIVAYILQPDSHLFLIASLGGATSVVLLALMYHKTIKHHDYPIYW